MTDAWKLTLAIATIVLIIGGLNWLFTALRMSTGAPGAPPDLFGAIGMRRVGVLVYYLVGLAAVAAATAMIYLHSNAD